MYERSLGADPALPSGASSSPVDLGSVAKTAAAVALIYHGYRRNRSLFWALVWGLAGHTVPIVAVPVSLAQGFGQPKPCPTEGG
jgi:hypothetical protein